MDDMCDLYFFEQNIFWFCVKINDQIRFTEYCVLIYAHGDQWLWISWVVYPHPQIFQSSCTQIFMQWKMKNN